MADVSIRNVTKRFGKTEVIHGISCDIRDGGFMGRTIFGDCYALGTKPVKKVNITTARALGFTALSRP